MVDLRQLKQILLLAECKNFSKASELACISQPALSVSIKKAEEYFNTKLFTRESKEIELTAQGEVIVKMARKVLESYSEGNLELTNMNSLKNGIVQFGIDTFLSRQVIGHIIPKIHKDFPGISFQINTNPWCDLIEDLKKSEIEFLIAVYSNKSDFPASNFDTIEIAIPLPTYYVRKNHPLTKMKEIDSRLLKNYQWAGHAVSPTWAKWAIEVTGNTELNIEKNQFLVKLKSNTEAIEVVINTDAISGHNYEELKPYVDSGKIQILENINWLIPHPENIGVIVTKKGKQLSPATELTIKEIQEYSKRWKKKKYIPIFDSLN